MAGNSFGNLFKLTTFGESHGETLGCIIDGCPAGIPLKIEDFQEDILISLSTEKTEIYSMLGQK